MTSFDILKTFFGVERSSPSFVISNLIIGGVAGTIAVTFTYPTDLIRRKLQMSGTPGYPKYNSMLHAASEIIKKEGPQGLYKGYLVCLLKVAPSMAILFGCNETLKSYFNKA